MEKEIKASMTMLRTFITNFTILNNKKIINDCETSLQLQFDVGVPQEFEIINDLILQAGLRVKINLIDSSSKEKITEIIAEINGDFKFASEDKEAITRMLKYNAIPLLYQEIRAYITTVTSLSHNKVIYLPMINFVNFFEKDKK